MSDKPEKLVIILKESVVESIIKDTYTFAGFAALLLINHHYLAGHVLVDVLFIAMVFMILATRTSSRAYVGNSKGAVDWLQGKSDGN